MTDEEIRIAILKALGWNCPKDITRLGAWMWKRPDGFTDYAPDYANDLNAMHEAWSTLDDYDKREFHVQLGFIVENETKNWDALLLLNQRSLIANATARQRAEAFLRTLGLWKEQP